MVSTACHPLLGGGNIVIDAGGDGGEDSRPQRTALIGGDNLQRAVQHIAAGLHDDWFFRAIPPRAITLLTGIPCSVKHSIMARAPKAVAAMRPPNSAGASVAVKIGDHPFQTLVGIRRAAAVEPVEHHRQVIEGRIIGPASVSAGSNCFWLALICSRNAGCC